MLTLPVRETKPRTLGLTMITDKGESLLQVQSILESYAAYIDIVKLGVGTAFIEPKLQEKIALYKKFNVQVYFGGTLFEKFFSQNKLEEYIEFVSQHNISAIEISTGTVDIELAERAKLVSRLKNEFNTVYAEVGAKDNERIMSPKEWVIEMASLLEAGADKVIAEGRDSATAGIYRPSGEVREGLIKDVVSEIDVEKIIFEAPDARTQMYFINLFGANVNLGNVALQDILLLETQRQALRFETFECSD